ncbi:pyridine nucleotide-disulfide oxidoreductase [Paenibacillus rhizosphaerae]|uniref:Pyridine nucleotide-disulfide oxidoreductase n=1 Tax=Paenibacillus rhizosphaerae TaxID=297318 RepID=A0A1R1F536_9BACL|nr:FAD-dependent oxidoreductase [Paenibacillus rhizosphaerae]OMF59056.1 pyridine nucleotide-disulfide oxidoreductase [Paenibacillus rhizosphaerae]
MKNETIRSDVTVIGGGLAGVCAAIAAARLGSQVVLVNNRPVLGGNSSSEVRVWVCGATAHGINRYARETGIMGELFVENQYRNPEGNPYLWDLVILEAVRAEPNITLLLNTDVHEVEADGPEENRTIRSVTGWMMGSERRIRMESPVFLDCTGDGLVGFMAGARSRIGREASREYGEAWAPEEADGITLGSTLLFYTKDAGHPVRFVPPSFAKDITQTPIPIKRVIRSGDSGCHYWWIEWGGELDTVHDNEVIRDELWSVIYGIWDYIKNSGRFEADAMTLEWVGSIPGKREYRRFVGDYVLNQNDIIAQEPFPDRIAFGGWSIDLHPPQGMYAEASGSKHMHADGIYHIPYRSLYSANVSNLLFAGRNISASHVAFGTTRVMATCAVMGEAAGTAAALCAAKGVPPRAIYRSHLHELQQTLLRQDAAVIGLRHEDDRDLARQAKVSASSVRGSIGVTKPHSAYRLERDAAILFPVEPGMQGLELLVNASGDTRLMVELWDTGRPENYVPCTKVAEAEAAVSKGEAQWISLPLAWAPDTPQNAFVIIRGNPDISLYRAAEPLTGVLAFEKGAVPNASADLEDHDENQPVVAWSMKALVRQPFCFKVLGTTAAYSPAKAVGGYKRPFGGPNLWASDSLGPEDEAWLQLTWESEITLQEVRLTWNDDVNEDLINLHHHRTPFEIIPELVKSYRLEARIRGEWSTIASVQDNRRRSNRIALNERISADALRLVIEETNGAPAAELVEIRVY